MKIVMCYTIEMNAIRDGRAVTFNIDIIKPIKFESVAKASEIFKARCEAQFFSRFVERRPFEFAGDEYCCDDFFVHDKNGVQIYEPPTFMTVNEWFKQAEDVKALENSLF